MRVLLFALPLLVLAAPAMAQERAKILSDVVDCRKLADSAERLACYDKTVGALDAAEQKKEVVVVDKEQVREARRSIFGLNLPRIKLFGGGGGANDIEDIDEIDTTIKAITWQRDGRVFFVVADGARWVQTDDRALMNVKPGGKVTIKKGTLGSYFAKFPGAIGIKVQRVN
jgi:hypothetical protein